MLITVICKNLKITEISESQEAGSGLIQDAKINGKSFLV